MTDQESPPAKPAYKSARRRAREFAVQGLYQWQLTQASSNDIDRFLRDSTTAFVRADEKLYQAIFFGVMRDMGQLKQELEPHLDRGEGELSPVEQAILWVGAFELLFKPETPYAVIINEAIEIAKTFGGTDGHKFVNGVLDKLALKARADEIASSRAARSRP